MKKGGNMEEENEAKGGKRWQKWRNHGGGKADKAAWGGNLAPSLEMGKPGVGKLGEGSLKSRATSVSTYGETRGGVMPNT